jgi:hypothetical protein
VLVIVVAGLSVAIAAYFRGRTMHDRMVAAATADLPCDPADVSIALSPFDSGDSARPSLYEAACVRGVVASGPNVGPTCRRSPTIAALARRTRWEWSCAHASALPRADDRRGLRIPWELAAPSRSSLDHGDVERVIQPRERRPEDRARRRVAHDRERVRRPRLNPG